jgi:hypothetical protein
MANLDFLQFSGGLQTTTGAFLKRDNQLDLSVNVHGDTIGDLTQRLGYAQSGGTVSAGNSILGMQSYYYLEGSTQLLYATANGTIYSYNGTAWSSVQAGLNATAKMNFKVFVDTLFLCGANSSNTYLTTASITGTTYSTTTQVADAPGAKYVEVYRNQLYLADCFISGTRYPSRFYWSSIPDISGDITWDTSGTSETYEEVDTDNGEPIMAIHTNSAINQLLIFKETSLHSWDTLRIRDIWNTGTTSARSVVTINGITYFFNEKGIWIYDGASCKLISRPIDKWIKGISSSYYGSVFAGNEDNFFLKLYVGDITVDGVTYTNCEIRYSVLDSTFTIYSYYHSFTCYALHEESNVIRNYAGDTTGKVFKLAQGTDAVYADDSNPISAQFMFTTDMGLPSQRKSVDRVLIYTERPQNLTGRIRAREKDWSSWFSIDRTEQARNVTPRDDRFLQFHFSSNSTVAPFIFEGLSFIASQSASDYA